MFNSSVLDVAIGLVFVYLLLGLMCTTVNEWLAQLFKTRAATLKRGNSPAAPCPAGRHLPDPPRGYQRGSAGEKIH